MNVWSTTFSDMYPLVAGTANIDSDPLFVDADASDYRIVVSPCVNRGTNLAWMVTAVDLDGNPRIKHTRVDMGAYESPGLLGTIFIIR